MKWTTDMCFNGRNYVPWKARVKTLLQTKRLWSIVTRLDLPPHEIQENFWKREHEATAFLMTFLSDGLVIAVSNKRYAYEIFEHLEKTNEPRNSRSLCAFREQFVTIKYEDGEDMLTPINNLKTLAGQLSNQAKSVDDMEKVCQLLRSLPTTWDSFKNMYYIQETPIAWKSMETNVMAEAAHRSAAECRSAVKRVVIETPQTETNAAFKHEQSSQQNPLKDRGVMVEEVEAIRRRIMATRNAVSEVSVTIVIKKGTMSETARCASATEVNKEKVQKVLMLLF